MASGSWSHFAAMLFTALTVTCCGGGGGSGGSEAAAVAAPAPTLTPTPAVMLAGVTTDDPSIRTAEQVDALVSLSQRVMVRATLDVGTSLSSYLPSITEISKVADIMAEPLDSSDMPKVDAAGARARIEQSLSIFGDRISVWEVGNEINGNWVGAAPMSKVAAMFDAVKSAGKRSALTLYYEHPPTPGFDMLPWVDAHIPQGHRMRSGLDYVFVSYYEDQNGGHQLTQSQLDDVFAGLARRFPGAKLGIGEFGWGNTVPSSDARRAELIKRFYGYRVPSVPSYIGGGFYWHFRQTMTPKTKPDWTVLNQAIGSNR